MRRASTSSLPAAVLNAHCPDALRLSGIGKSQLVGPITRISLPALSLRQRFIRVYRSRKSSPACPCPRLYRRRTRAFCCRVRRSRSGRSGPHSSPLRRARHRPLRVTRTSVGRHLPHLRRSRSPCAHSTARQSRCCKDHRGQGGEDVPCVRHPGARTTQSQHASPPIAGSNIAFGIRSISGDTRRHRCDQR